MSVKGKVKRCNKRIDELEKEVKRLKQKNETMQVLNLNRYEEEIKKYKDNFIKLILSERKPLENSCCRLNVSMRQLNMVNDAKLEVERDITTFDGISFIFKI